MRLTIFERGRLETLLAWHCRPPRSRWFVLRAAVFIAIQFGLLSVFVMILARRVPHDRFDDFLIGALCCSFFYSIANIVRAPFRWRLTEAITDWRRIEELQAATARKGA